MTEPEYALTDKVELWNINYQFRVKTFIKRLN